MSSSFVVNAIRYGLPAAILVAGVVLVLAGGDGATGAGIVLIGVAALVLVLNAFARLAISSEEDRAREERARRHFSRHGRWPGGRGS